MHWQALLGRANPPRRPLAGHQEGCVRPDRKRRAPPPGGNRGTSRPHLALRGTTWHKSAPYM